MINFPDFYAYLKSKGISLGDVKALDFGKREKFFLKWKWGSSNYDSNVECERTWQYLDKTEQKESQEIKDPQSLKYSQWRKRTQEYCKKIKGDLGLLRNETTKKLDSIVAKAEVNWQD